MDTKLLSASVQPISGTIFEREVVKNCSRYRGVGWTDAEL